MIRFRPAREEDVPEVLALLTDDAPGRGREHRSGAAHLAAVHRMQGEPTIACPPFP